MLYQSELDLPRDVRDVLPSEALKLYRLAYMRAWRQVRVRHERERDLASHAAAWRTVKRSFAKNREGEWVRRDVTAAPDLDL